MARRSKFKRGASAAAYALASQRILEASNINVTEISLEGLSALASLPDIVQPERIRKLSLRDTRIRDLSPLQRMTELEELDLSGTQIADISPLVSLASLRVLNLSGAPLTNLQHLSQLNNLEVLHIVGAKTKNITPLQKLTKLQELTLVDLGVTDLSPLADLRQLRILDVTFNGLSDISPLRSLVDLRAFEFSVNRVSDLTPIAELARLEVLLANSNPIADISVLAKLSHLRVVDLDRTNISDLSAVANLRRLITAPYDLYYDRRLSFRYCDSIRDENLQFFSTLEDSERTFRTISYLRQQLNLPNLTELRSYESGEGELTIPPSIPAQGRGPHFALRPDGLIGFAPPEAIDKKGNNVANLRVLHPTLRMLSHKLSEALGLGNVPHANLYERITNYSDLVDQELDHVPFDRLYVEGVRLQNAATAAAEKIAEKELPPLGTEVREGLESILKLHGPFMLSTAIGLELIESEERYQRNPQQELALLEASQAFALELQSRPDIISTDAANFIAGAVQGIGAGHNAERSTVVATGVIKNVAVVLISGATIGALPIVGGVLAGTMGVVGGGLAALIGVEGLKKSKSFLAIAGVVTQGLDKLREADTQRLILANGRRLAPYAGFVLKIEPTLRRLGQRSQFSWINDSLDWLRSHTAHNETEG